MIFRIDSLWAKKRRVTILLLAFPKGYRQVTTRPTSIEQPTPCWREPPACSSPVVENLAIFLGKGHCYLLHLFINLPCQSLSIYVGYRYIHVAYNLRQESHR